MPAGTGAETAALALVCRVRGAGSQCPMRLASYHTTYGSHRGAWCTFHEVRTLAMLVTEDGPKVLESADELTEGTILRAYDGRYLEVFIVDFKGRYFCESVEVGETAA
jgi:hypothetical protein